MSLESFLWFSFALVFPLFIYPAGYDSFHEPKWFFFIAFLGILLLIRFCRTIPARFCKTSSPYRAPLLAFLICSFLALRWQAGDCWVTFALWIRLPLACLFIHLLYDWLVTMEERQRWRSIRHLLTACVIGGAGVAFLTILQDWGFCRWGDEPVSDWRFHLSSTLGNPNEVGGYLCYLLPIILVNWFRPERSVWGTWFWGITGLLYLYALTTVFTVGVWLPLLIVFPLIFWIGKDGLRIPLTIISILLLLLIRLLFIESLLPLHRLGVFLFFVLLILGMCTWQRFLHVDQLVRQWVILALSGLFLVWGILLFPWGIPNHPTGLIEEALSSPRWKGGLGARRFIWTTTALMVKDHPIRGIGWGHYYAVHGLYQGELYRQRGIPHDRPTVGLVPQAHSDPLQILTETGLGGGIAFFWLCGVIVKVSVIRLRERRPTGKPPSVISDSQIPDNSPYYGGLSASLWLIFSHCLVDFPLRQPQPVILALIFMTLLSLARKQSVVTCEPSLKTILFGKGAKYLIVCVAIALIGVSLLGFRDQILLKRGYEGLLAASTSASAPLRDERARLAAAYLDQIDYPLPETHDRWLYRARLAMILSDWNTAHTALLSAGKYRYSLALYETWKEFGRLTRNPEVSLHAVERMLLGNPCWAGYHDEKARLLRLLGRNREADLVQQMADRLRVPEKPGP